MDPKQLYTDEDWEEYSNLLDARKEEDGSTSYYDVEYEANSYSQKQWASKLYSVGTRCFTDAQRGRDFAKRAMFASKRTQEAHKILYDYGCSPYKTGKYICDIPVKENASEGAACAGVESFWKKWATLSSSCGTYEGPLFLALSLRDKKEDCRAQRSWGSYMYFPELDFSVDTLRLSISDIDQFLEEFGWKEMAAYIETYNDLLTGDNDDRDEPTQRRKERACAELGELMKNLQLTITLPSEDGEDSVLIST
ncbi:MAG: hypothetical protein SGILL_003989, partial [Bacillariaceae sp.]